MYSCDVAFSFLVSNNALQTAEKSSTCCYPTSKLMVNHPAANNKISLNSSISSGNEQSTIANRRDFNKLASVMFLTLLSDTVSLEANASENNDGDQQETNQLNSPKSNFISKKPYASNDEALVPAVRVKLTIDEAIQVVKDTSNDQETVTKTVIQLENLLLKPQNYTQSMELQGVPNQPAKQYLDSYKPMTGDLPFQLYLIKNGDVSTWKNLKRKEKEQEKVDEVRAAFNAYTDVLSFSGDSYLLNVDSKTKSSMIRGDKLPELKQVITSDMGMRYLYRNQILTAMEDVKAEFQYQLALIDKGGSGVDFNELLNLLMGAKLACDKWFSLIDEADIQSAILIASQEREHH